MNAFKGSRYQRGHAPFAEGFFALLFWAIGIFVAATIAIPAWIGVRRRSKGWGFAAVALLAFWIYLVVTQIVLPSNKTEVRNEWIQSARERCAGELATLRPEFRTEGVLDSSGVIHADWIVPMLTDRRLRYIEARGSDQNPMLIAREPRRTNESERLSWIHAPTPWVRIQLARVGDPNCVAVPPRLRDELEKAPLAADTCLALIPILEPTAPLEVKLIQPADEDTKAHGRWGIVDRTSGKLAAQLTTIDSLGTVSTDGKLRGKDEGRANDGSHIPAQMLFERIFGSDERPISEQVFARELVRADQSPDTLSLSRDRFTRVQADVSIRQLAKEQADLLRFPSWAAALESASSAGVGGFKDLHIDSVRRQLVRLESGKSSSQYRWQVLGDERGFFVFEQYPIVAGSLEHLLIHYDRAGRLNRAFLIELGKDPIWRQGMVSTIRIEKGSLLIEGGPTGAPESLWQVQVLRFRLPS